MTDKETGNEAEKETDKGTDKGAWDKPKKQQNENDGSLDDKEMAILLLGMEEELCRRYQDAENETFSSTLESLLSGFQQSSNRNRRNVRDLIVRHEWFTAEAAKREDYEKVIRKFEDSSPPVI